MTLTMAPTMTLFQVLQEFSRDPPPEWQFCHSFSILRASLKGPQIADYFFIYYLDALLGGISLFYPLYCSDPLRITYLFISLLELRASIISITLFSYFGPKSTYSFARTPLKDPHCN